MRNRDFAIFIESPSIQFAPFPQIPTRPFSQIYLRGNGVGESNCHRKNSIALLFLFGVG
jgi:hypothetical protein